MVHVWQRAEWQSLTAAHEQRVRPWLEPRLRRRREHTVHPVDDFLWSYYRFRPGQLQQWHPGWRGAAADHDELRDDPQYSTVAGVSAVAPVISRQRRHRIDRAVAILSATAERPPVHSCFGMHEWAMVYRQDPAQLRHAVPLRVSPAAVVDVVDEVGLRCTHFDAYRFFTPAAAGRQEPLTRQDQAASEQPGCIHAGMDLYRYAYETWPFVASDLVADCFEFARAAREIDMRASPYDLTELGVAAIPVETVAGRAQYAALQRSLTAAAESLRARLLAELAGIRAWASPG